MQEYKLVVRSLTTGATSFAQDGALVNQNFAEFISYLNENYLEQGYTVLSVDFVSKTPANEFGSPVTYEFAYHLVKEVKSAEVPGKSQIIVDTKFFLFVLIGGLFIWLGMKFPPFSQSRFDFVRNLWTCSLCCGVWVYTFLSCVMGEVLFRDLFYVPFISELATGGIVSFVVWLASMGFREYFVVIEII